VLPYEDAAGQPGTPRDSLSAPQYSILSTLGISNFRHFFARVAELADALDLGTDQALFLPFSNPSEFNVILCFHSTNLKSTSQVESGPNKGSRAKFGQSLGRNRIESPALPILKT